MRRKIILALCVVLCLTTAGCAKSVNNNDDTENTTISQSTEVTQQNNTTSDNDTKGLNIVKGFYGKTFNVEFNKSNGNTEQYTVYTKMGNVYSTVTIDFDNAKMVEKIASADEANEYDLNSIKTED